VVGDVQDGTPLSHFLNDSVDRFSATGHKGGFFQPHELTSLLQAAGFQGVTERHQHFTWKFPDITTLVWCCKHLFGMVKADDQHVEMELRRFFTMEITSNAAHPPWSLVYAVGTKPM